jgi:hypothetical protein
MAWVISWAGGSGAQGFDPLLAPGPERTRTLVGVEDAFGPELRFSLGFEESWRRSRIRREAGAPGALTTRPALVGIEGASRLLLASELGLLRGFSVILEAPVLLSTSRVLRAAGGSDRTGWQGALGEVLFVPPVESSGRSGVENLGVGLAWAPPYDTWGSLPRPRLLAEGRFAVAEPMHAARGGDRPGQGEAAARQGPGLSRGSHSLRLNATFSKRWPRVQPYFGGEVEWQWALPGSAFPRDSVAPGPPRRTSLLLGAEVVGWELEERFQRLSFELGAQLSEFTRGSDYTDLFDALGSSESEAYRRPAPTRYTENLDPVTAALFPSVAEEGSRAVIPTGIDTVGSHLKLQFQLKVRWRAGRYIRFEMGGSLGFEQSHLLTSAAPCVGRTAAPAAAGYCPGLGLSGVPNPHYRPEVHEPGQRYWLDGALSGSAGGSATVLF